MAPSLQIPSTDRRPQDGLHGRGRGTENGKGMCLVRCEGLRECFVLERQPVLYYILPRKPQWANALRKCFPGCESNNSSFTKKSCTCAFIALPAGFMCRPVNSSSCGTVRVVSSVCICSLVHCHVAVSNAQNAASNDELERMWMKMVVAWFKVQFPHFPTGTQENHNQSINQLSVLRPRFKHGTSLTTT
jgi:hypothetical protein